MIKYIELNNGNFSCNSLDGFIRRQRVEECWRKVGSGYALLPVTYTEEWSQKECRQLAERILNELSSGSIAYGAENDGQIVGFAFILKERFGSDNQYVDLAEFYVSEPFRRYGIGRELFSLACNAAKKLGAKKLYISAHSAKESIAAYKSYGCTLAEEINQTLAEKEPCDLQLEFVLK